MNANLFKKFDVVQSEDGKSMYIDVDIDSHLARLTIWVRGEGMGACDMEVLDVASEKQVLWQHSDFSNSTQFHAALGDFTRRLRDLAGQQPDSIGDLPLNHPFELRLEDKKIGLDGVLEPLLIAAG